MKALYNANSNIHFGTKNVGPMPLPYIHCAVSSMSYCISLFHNFIYGRNFSRRKRDIFNTKYLDNFFYCGKPNVL